MVIDAYYNNCCYLVCKCIKYNNMEKYEQDIAIFQMG